MSNVDNDAKRDFVDRVFQIESDFLTAKVERNDLIKDIKVEIKSKAEQTGVDFKEVMRLAKIKLAEQETREKMAQDEADIAVYDLLFGNSSEAVDPLA